MRKIVASVAAAGTLAAGGTAVAVLNPFQGAGAQTAPPTTAPASPRAAGRGDALKKILDDLVSKGTITQQQEDAIVQAVKSHVGVEGKGRLGRFALHRKELGTEVAKLLNTTPQDLRAQLKSGKSIADVANAQGVPLATVTDGLTKAIDGRIDQAVTSGKLDQQRADAFKAKVPTLVDRIVNHKKGG